MSNGELSGSDPQSHIQFNPVTFMAKVASETLAIEFAAGDVVGANAQLAEEVIYAQRNVTRKENALTDRQRELKERLEGMGIKGKPINFESGRALGAADYSDEREQPHSDPKTVGEDLAGSNGVIADFEVGTYLGKPLDPEAPEAIVFLVEMDESSEMLCAGVEGYRYGILATQADYAIGETPGPEDQPQER